jgi:hypothetical protein
LGRWKEFVVIEPNAPPAAIRVSFEHFFVFLSPRPPKIRILCRRTPPNHVPLFRERIMGMPIFRNFFSFAVLQVAVGGLTFICARRQRQAICAA